MGLIDTHCHLYLDDFDPEQDCLIEEARNSGIEALLLPNVDTGTINRMHELCERHPGFTYPMMGLHPTSVKEDYAKHLKEVETCLLSYPYIAIGEIGIDLYWDKTWIKEQKIVFEEQLRWSIEKKLPVVIHTRDAFPEVFECIHNVGAQALTGVFHSFSGTADDLEEIKRLPNFMIGINGVITFKNSKLSETIQNITIDKVLLETDAPYLAPVPYRGKRNNPTYIWKTAEKVADTYNLTLEETVKITSKNARKLFRNIN